MMKRYFEELSFKIMTLSTPHSLSFKGGRINERLIVVFSKNPEKRAMELESKKDLGRVRLK